MSEASDTTAARPWKTDGRCVTLEDGTLICLVSQPDPKRSGGVKASEEIQKNRAALIVHAVNNLEPLLASVREMRAIVAHESGGYTDPQYLDVLARADAAIAGAEKEM